MNSGRSMVSNMSASSRSLSSRGSPSMLCVIRRLTSSALRPVLVALVAVELHLAERQRADHLAVLLAVADVHDGLVGRRMVVSVDRRQRAEALGEAHLRLLVEILAAQHDDQMLVPRVADALEGRIVQRPREVDAADLGAEGGRKGNHFDHPRKIQQRRAAGGPALY